MNKTQTAWDKMIPWYFVIFFAVIMLVDGTMATLAIRTNSGTVTEHPYEEGLAYNQVVAAEKQQQMLGWSSDLNITGATLHFILHDARGQTIRFSKATASMTRPTQEGMDFTVVLRGEDTPIQFPAKGLWEVRVEAVANGQYYQHAQRMVIP